MRRTEPMAGIGNHPTYGLPRGLRIPHAPDDGLEVLDADLLVRVGQRQRRRVHAPAPEPNALSRMHAVNLWWPCWSVVNALLRLNLLSPQCKERFRVPTQVVGSIPKAAQQPALAERRVGDARQNLLLRLRLRREVQGDR